MYIAKPQNLTLSILATLVIAMSLGSTVEATGIAHEGALKRDHIHLKRMFKKRSPQDNPLFPNFRGSDSPGPVAGAGSDPASLTESSSSSTPPTSSPTPSSISSSASSSVSSVSSVSSSASSSSVASSSSSSASSISQSSSVSESSSSSLTTSTPTSAPAAPTSETLNLQGDNAPTPVANNPSTITRTQSQTAVAQETETPPQVSGAAKTKSNVLTILIAVAASVAGVAIIWTIFRKWKLARSSKFDERLQPIDWQPTTPDEGIIPAHRRVTSDTSFQSGSNHHDNNFAGRGASGGYGATSDNGHGSDYGHNASAYDHGQRLAPVGGYADLARGPSPQPQMQQVNHGSAFGQPNYDVGVPLHHQAGHAEAYDYHGAPIRF
ncbi:hypothetical protein ONZ45_g8413 [Pleurotus djamor]|nr:hypothetical protein ONZ45_g8413 [Pleurotus djamor]